jgi:hypothetical protein
MKTLRISALILALSVCSIAAFAQQEIDPDHFDSASVAAAHVKGSRMASSHKAASQNSANGKLAARHSHKAHHQHA